ncbi:MAG: hypothetical protein C4293_08800, partial [Nitrospiraceae bacterium]
SHRVLLHAPCSVLVVKGAPTKVKHVLLAVEGPEDAEQLKGWLLKHPFKNPADLHVLHVVPHPRFGDLKTVSSLKPWAQAAMKSAHALVRSIAGELNGPNYAISEQVLCGDPLEIIAQRACRSDLLIVGSHGRTGLRRFLLGSVSHALVHRVGCPILIVR